MSTSKERSNSQDGNVIELGWDELHDMVRSLGRMVRVSGKQIDYIYGVPRGGLIPAVILSHQLQVPYISNIMDGKGGTVLIVDDLTDTGHTVISLIGFRNALIATLFKHKKCKVVPDFYVKENDCWIHFPFEED